MCFFYFEYFLIWTSFYTSKISKQQCNSFYSFTPRYQKQYDQHSKKIGTDLLQLIDQKFLPEGTTLQSHTETMKKMNQFRSNATGTLNAEPIRAGEVYVYIYIFSQML